MRIKIIENCVAEGSVWFGGEEVWVDEVVGRKMVEMGKAREMQFNHGDPVQEPGHGTGNTESLMVEMRVVKAKERAVSVRERKAKISPPESPAEDRQG
jgi:hypothetical protein